jgi:hypothetical protein
MRPPAKARLRPPYPCLLELSARNHLSDAVGKSGSLCRRAPIKESEVEGSHSHILILGDEELAYRRPAAVFGIPDAAVT